MEVSFKRIIVIIFFAGIFRTVAGQDGVFTSRQDELPVLDISQTSVLTYDVARFDNAGVNFPSAVRTGITRRELVATYIKSDTSRSIRLARSADGGRTWNEVPVRNNWNGDGFRSLSLFNLGQPIVQPKMKKSEQPRNSLVMFSGGDPVMVSMSLTNGLSWSNFSPANNFGGFRISSLSELRDGRIMALFHDDGRFLFSENDSLRMWKSAIYKIYSSDGGLTWSRPEVALKHNLHGLYDAVAFYSPKRKNREMIIIASDRVTSESYIAFSDDDGQSWSYPEKLPHFIHGDRFGVAGYKKELYIAFRDMCRILDDGTPNPFFGDLVLWTGDLKELLKKHRNGIKVRLADNYPTSNPVDYEDRKFFDCGYISVLPLSSREVSVIAHGRWETDEEPFVRNFVFDPSKVRKMGKKIR